MSNLVALNALKGAAGVSGEEAVCVDDLFSHYLYTATGSALTINNGIDNSTEGGAVWIKQKNAVGGFVLGTDSAYNNSGNFYSSYNFRKNEKFFDVVQYTGNGSTQAISHNLNGTVGCIMVKKIGADTPWQIYHRSLGNTHYMTTYYTIPADSNARWNDTSPTTTHFTVGSGGYVNTSGQSYIAYIFGHNDGDGIFGPNGDQDIIKCGTYNGDGSINGSNSIDLGFVPDFLLIKCTDYATQYALFNPMNKISDLRRNDDITRLEDDAVVTSQNRIKLTSTGFALTENDTETNGDGRPYVYIAIAAASGNNSKVPSAGTDCFAMDTGSNASDPPNFDSGFPVELGIVKDPDGSGDWRLSTRWTPGYVLDTAVDIEEASSGFYGFHSSVGWANEITSSYQSWMWKRGPGLEVLTFQGNETARTINHNMGRVPEMMWLKVRSATVDWICYHKGLNGGSNADDYYLKVNTDGAEVSDANVIGTAPTSSVFSIGSSSLANDDGEAMLAILFASVDGISSVGSYTGNGNTISGGSPLTITTGFQPRLIIVKGTAASRNWLIFDSLRGVGSGNEYYFTLNENNAQTGATDYVEVTSTGFKVGNNNNIGANTEEYIYYAHA